MNKFLIISVLFLFSLSFEANSQNTENIIKVAIPTKYGNFNIIKEEKISKKSSFNNKRQSVETISDVTTKVYALANELEISDLVKKDLSKYKNYDEDIIVVLSFDKMGKMKSYEYKQESVLASLNKFYSQVLDNVKAKMTPSQTKQLINLETETTLKVRLTYTKK